MWDRFVPDAYILDFTSFDDINCMQLGKRVVACDIDNTLVAHDVEEADEKAISFLTHLKQQGYRVILVSNNWKSRVSKFAKSVNLPYIAFAKKPLPFVFYQIKKKMNCELKEIVLLGDQMLTDVFGAKMAQVFVVLCDPLVKRDLTYTKFNRLIETWICKQLAKRELFHKGEYYGKEKL